MKSPQQSILSVLGILLVSLLTVDYVFAAGAAIGIDYHATGESLGTDGFIPRYHEPGVSETVREQLQRMVDEGASVVTTNLWLGDNRVPSPPPENAWQQNHNA